MHPVHVLAYIVSMKVQSEHPEGHGIHLLNIPVPNDSIVSTDPQEVSQVY